MIFKSIKKQNTQKEELIYGQDFKYALCIYHNIFTEDEISKAFAEKAANEKEWKSNIVNWWKN